MRVCIHSSIYLVLWVSYVACVCSINGWLRMADNRLLKSNTHPYRSGVADLTVLFVWYCIFWSCHSRSNFQLFSYLIQTIRLIIGGSVWATAKLGVVWHTASCRKENSCCYAYILTGPTYKAISSAFCTYWVLFCICLARMLFEASF